MRPGLNLDQVGANSAMTHVLGVSAKVRRNIWLKWEVMMNYIHWEEKKLRSPIEGTDVNEVSVRSTPRPMSTGHRSRSIELLPLHTLIIYSDQFLASKIHGTLNLKNKKYIYSPLDSSLPTWEIFYTTLHFSISRASCGRLRSNYIWTGWVWEITHSNPRRHKKGRSV
jgi:hypothetical protein